MTREELTMVQGLVDAEREALVGAVRARDAGERSAARVAGSQ